MSDPAESTSSPAAALRPTTFNRHLANVYPALAMLAGMQLDVFSPLAAGPLTVEQLAARLNVQAQKLRPLMYALVAADMLSLVDERFANTEESNEFLVAGRPRYVGGTHGAYADLWSATLHTADSIRSGQPQARHDFSRMAYPELKAFMLGLDAGASATARRLHKDFNIAGGGHVLDAGGGAGGLAIALCALGPTVGATVAELANVAPIARECVRDAGLTERIDVIECDLVGAPPPGAYSAVIMRALLQVMSNADAQATVHHGAAVLQSGGGLYIVGRALDDTRLSPLDAVAANVMFLNIYDDGQAYTEAEYRAWLRDAGLVDIQRQVLAGGYSIIHGRKI